MARTGSELPGLKLLTGALGLAVVAAGVALVLRGDPRPAPVAPQDVAARTPEPAAAGPPAPAEPGPKEAAGPSPTELPLRLVATAVHADAGLSLATLEDTERPGQQVLAEGQPLGGRPSVQLARIERARVLLDNDGVLEVLEIEHQQRPPGPAPVFELTPELRERRRDLSARIRGLSEHGVARAALRGGLLAEGDVTPVWGEAGELRGIRLEALREGGLYERFGLREGDVVTAVNGISLGDEAALGAAISELALSDELQLEVERQDGPQEVVPVPTDELRALLGELGPAPDGLPPLSELPEPLGALPDEVRQQLLEAAPPPGEATP